MDLIDREKLLRDIEEFHLSDCNFDEWVEIVEIQPKAVPWEEFKLREMTEEEKESFPDCCFIFDCKLPEDGQDVLVSDGFYVWADVFYNGGSDGCGLEGRGEIEDGMAWMPMPEPYRGD